MARDVLIVEDRAMIKNVLSFRSQRVLMSMLLAMALFLLLSGCALPPSTLKPVLEDEGEVQVFLQPFPQEAQRLKFTIEGLSLVASDGRAFPLSLAVTEFQAGAPQRQRFLAAGRVPPGTFSGLSLKVTKATLSGEEGDTSMLVPEEPVLVPLSIEVRRKKVVVLCLAFQFAGSVQSGFNFTPRFSLYVPSLPASGLLGYVVNQADNTLTVFDKKTGQVAAIMATGRGPERVVFDQNSLTAYLTLAGEDAVDVIDLTNGEVTHRINLKIGDGPSNIALTPDGRFLLTVNARSRTLSIIDPVALLESSRVPLGEEPRWLLVDPTGNRCYVFNGLSNTMTVIDIAYSATVATITTDAGPLMGQFNGKGDRLYVVHEGSPYLLVFDRFSLSVTKRVFIGYGVGVIKVDTKSDLLYVSRKGDARIEVYEPFSLNLTDYLPAMSDIVYMTIDGEANSLFFLSAEKRRLQSVNLVSRKAVTETDIGENPAWVTMMGER
jgi:YVTN family beta-propeller protein